MDHISAQAAADKADIRKWLRIGVERGKTAMIVVHDEMRYPDNCDSPYYCDDAEDVYNLLRDFDHDPMSKVMEIYDLTADIEAQLDEHRAWHLPDLPETESEEEAPPWRYPALGLLASGETRLAFMEMNTVPRICILIRKEQTSSWIITTVLGCIPFRAVFF